MDAELIKKFRDKVNDGEFVLNKYRDKEGKNKWSIICSAMDWIEVVVESIDVKNLSRENDNDASLKMMNFIMCIDIMWEAIQQLHRVFLDTDSIPFTKEDAIFKNKVYPDTDNGYFKTIRACFATHPININSIDGKRGENEERWYASWSGGTFGRSDFSVLLYSNIPNKDITSFDVSFSELMEFAQKRYEYLNTLMDEIARQRTGHIEFWKRQPIRKLENPIEQIKILTEEIEKRCIPSEYYSYLFELIGIIFETPISNENNIAAVEEYKLALQKQIEEVYCVVQDMSDKDIESDIDTSLHVPSSVLYCFSKLSDYVHTGRFEFIVGERSLLEYIGEFVDVNGYQSEKELYVLAKTAFYLSKKRG